MKLKIENWREGARYDFKDVDVGILIHTPSQIFQIYKNKYGYRWHMYRWTSLNRLSSTLAKIEAKIAKLDPVTAPEPKLVEIRERRLDPEL